MNKLLAALAVPTFALAASGQTFARVELSPVTRPAVVAPLAGAPLAAAGLALPSLTPALATALPAPSAPEPATPRALLSVMTAADLKPAQLEARQASSYDGSALKDAPAAAVAAPLEAPSRSFLTKPVVAAAAFAAASVPALAHSGGHAARHAQTLGEGAVALAAIALFAAFIAWDKLGPIWETRAATRLLWKSRADISDIKVEGEINDMMSAGRPGLITVFIRDDRAPELRAEHPGLTMPNGSYYLLRYELDPKVAAVKRAAELADAIEKDGL